MDSTLRDLCKNFQNQPFVDEEHIINVSKFQVTSTIDAKIKGGNKVEYDCKVPVVNRVLGQLCHSLQNRGNPYDLANNLGGYSFFRMTEINSPQLKAFIFNAEMMFKKGRDVDPHYSINETYMWHGCPPSAKDGILLNGFKEQYTASTSGRAAFGIGTYFAVHADLSLQRDYAKAEHYKDKNNKEYHRKCLFYCRVLRGNSVQGHQQEKQLPEWKKGVLYDSFTDQPSDPHIAVVKDGFAIPVFLLEFVKPK